jgi:hypothetical protein
MNRHGFYVLDNEFLLQAGGERPTSTTAIIAKALPYPGMLMIINEVTDFDATRPESQDIEIEQVKPTWLRPDRQNKRMVE